MKIIKISKGQFMSDIMSEIPSHAVFFKTVPGLGATTLERDCKRNSILIEPNVPVIKGKRKKGILAIYEGVTIDTVVDYMSSDIPYKKIFVTPESYFKVQQAAEILKINLFNTYFMLVDESDKVIKDVNFRAKITLPINDFFKYQKKSFISATAIMPSNPKFTEQGFEKLVIQPTYNYGKKIKLITTNNVYLSFKKLLEEKPSDNYCIFLNSTNLIGAVIKKLGIKDQSTVYCSRESMYQLKASGLNHVHENLSKFSKYNFFTCRFNSAVDIFMDTKPTIIMVTDLVSARHSMIHPTTEAVQIVGRFRKGFESITHITNLDPELQPKSPIEIAAYLQGCEQSYNDIRALYRSATNQGAKDTLSEALRLVPYAAFINEDGTKNYFMEDNMFLEEEMKSCFISEDAINEAYNHPHFTATHITETYSLNDNDNHKLTSGISMIDVVNSVISSMEEITNTGSLYTFDNRQTVLSELEKSFPDIMQGYKLLGAAELRKNGYSKKQIKKAIRQKIEIQQKSNFGLLRSLQSFFIVGSDYESPDIKRALERSIKANGLDLKPTIGLLADFYEISNRKTIGYRDEKELKGYKIKSARFRD